MTLSALAGNAARFEGRTSPRTFWPTLINARTSAAPTLPVAPVTKIMRNHLLRAPRTWMQRKSERFDPTSRAVGAGPSSHPGHFTSAWRLALRLGDVGGSVRYAHDGGQGAAVVPARAHRLLSARRTA